MAQNAARLKSDSSTVRARAAEALGFLRAYAAEAALIERLRDDRSASVRCKAALSLGWCGGRKAVPPLLAALDDRDWQTAQAAHVALTNLTGMEFPFDAAGPSDKRTSQARRWRDWWAAVSPDQPPGDVLDLLGGDEVLARPVVLPAARPDSPTLGKPVTASTTYRGPPGVLTDGYVGPLYWQTKFVDPPQSCTVDLGQPVDVHRVIVHQYGPQFVMTSYEVAVSLDGQSFDAVERRDGESSVTLVVDFPKREVRFIRITSFGSKNPTYPTTFFEIEINRQTAVQRSPEQSTASREQELKAWREERGLRALGALGGRGATAAVLAVLGPDPSTAPHYRPTVRTGIRALGRLGDERGFQYLVALLKNPFWARAAAEALGDFGGARAVSALIEAYPQYAKDLQAQDPPAVPRDDKMGFPSEDRMLETPYWIIYSMCRLPLDRDADRAALRKIAPQIMANLPGDHDTFFLYEPEVAHLLTRHLMELAGFRQEAAEQAFEQLGQKRRVPAPAGELAWSRLPAYWISSWLPCVCTEREDLPRLLALLDHPEGWVRLNAAKTIAWLGDPAAVEPLAAKLAGAKAEADYGYSGTFKDEEYNDPAPRWREGLIRALGLLGAHDHTELLASILNDERSVAEIRLAAAQALADLGNERALAALHRAATEHPIYCVRHAARDALQERGIAVDAPKNKASESAGTAAETACPDITPAESTAGLEDVPALVFIKGSNDIPNTKGTVEQADRWRQTYAVTDSGPAYRPGRNLYLLKPPRPDGTITPLTRFPDGYVAEPELSWDATHVIFSYRGQADPWWQIYRVNLDGSGLKQLTSGPYHHVGPAYLPDGRIVLATSRSGIRDEYHGYPCTALSVMNADGSGLQFLATNIGRDNEPAVLHDGRVAFSRLEVFYSRNKTELTLHAAHLDGTLDAVLYGPERRPFWRNLDHGPRTPADGQEAPLTHRVLRMTQPQPMPDGRNMVVVTQGGLALVGTARDREQIITPDNKTRAYTTPMPLPDGTILCASTEKVEEREKVDLGLYLFDPATQSLELIYNDPAAADFEPRPVLRRAVPQLRPERAEPGAYSGHFLCTSVYATQERHVPQRGRLVRLIEGLPAPARHSTHTNPWPVWKNHGGTFARVLGMAPLAADGSFYVEAPADRLMHFQVLDSDRRVVGNQKTWIYPRPGETKGCIGCHENPHTTTRGNDPLASHYRPLSFLPDGNEFTYRAKAWFKGHLPDEIEERTRTVRAVNLLGRQ